MSRKIGLRFLRSKKGTSFLSVITAISVGGVAVGVLTMIVTLSVMTGFETELKKRLFAGEAHILVESKEGYFQSSQELLDKIYTASTQIKAVSPILETEVILRADQKMSGAVLHGVLSEQWSEIKKNIVEWAPEEFRHANTAAVLYLGQEMAYNLGLVPGDSITLVSPIESEGPLGLVPRVKKYFIEGIYKTGIPDQELHTVFAQMSDVEAFIRQQNILSHIEVKLDQLEHSTDVKRALEGRLSSSYRVRSWQELNAHLFDSLKLERLVMFCILIFIVIVASFNIIGTLTMMVIEKKRSLSILRAMGATPNQISSIFRWEGFAIAFVGVFLGTTIGLVICNLLSKYPIIELPDVYYDRSLPIVVDPFFVSLIIFTTVFIVILGAYFPAKKASEISPLQGIKEGS